MLQETYKNEFKSLKYNEQDLEPNIDYMSFNKLSTTLALCLLSGITLILLILGYVMLFISIKRSMSRTKYILNENENNNNLNNDKNITDFKINITEN